MSKKSKSTTGPSKFAEPFIKQGAGALNSAYDANSGTVQEQTDSVLGLLNPFLVQRIGEGDTGVNAARDYGVDVLSGKYLDQGNPHLQGVIDDTNNDIVNQAQAALSLKGLTGGSNYADIISRNVGKNTTNLRYNDYARERAAQDSAAGRAGSIAAADYLPVAGLLSTLDAAQAPIDAAGKYAAGLGGLLGQYTTTTAKKSPWDILLGAAGQAAGAYAASERRVKRDIERIGALPDGLGIYNYRYLWDDDKTPLHTGVMVDEVAELRPWALGPIVDGIQTVDYSMLEGV